MAPLLRSFAFFALTFTAFLTGCAINPPMFLYEGPQRAATEVAQIRVADSTSYSGNKASYDWTSYVLAVNGKSVRESGRVHLLPGKYKVTMQCFPHPKYTSFQKSTTIELDLDALAGQTYYPWCDKSVAAVVVNAGRVAHSNQLGRFVPYLSVTPAP